MAARLAVAALLASLLAGTALAAPGDPERRAIRKADQAWARRALLKLGDLPAGFIGHKAGGGNNRTFTCKGYAPDLSDLTITGDASSPAFVNTAGTTIFAGAEVYKSLHDEDASWNRTVRTGALRCIAGILEQQSTAQIRIKVTSKSMHTGPSLGDRSASFRVFAMISASGTHFGAWLDALAVEHGRADATLIMMTFRKAPSASLENRLFATVAHRLGV